MTKRCRHDYRQLQEVVFLLWVIANIVSVHCNSEGDVLNAWKRMVVDPNNVLQSWDPTLVNPCTWFHVTCNSLNRVTRLDLGNAGLSGPLPPQLPILSNLQYLELYKNNFTGFIPKEIGSLKNLVSLDLYHNQLGGSIPVTLANLKSLKYMRLNNNQLSGKLPAKLLSLIFWGNLRIMDVSGNQLDGTVHHVNATVTTIIQDPKA